jgi:hypothetical protein
MILMETGDRHGNYALTSGLCPQGLGLRCRLSAPKTSE